MKVGNERDMGCPLDPWLEDAQPDVDVEVLDVLLDSNSKHSYNNQIKTLLLLSVLDNNLGGGGGGAYNNNI